MKGRRSIRRVLSGGACLVFISLAVVSPSHATTTMVARGTLTAGAGPFIPLPEHGKYVLDGCTATQQSGSLQALIPVKAAWKGEFMTLRDKGAEEVGMGTSVVVGLFAKQCTPESFLNASPFNTDEYAQAALVANREVQTFKVIGSAKFLIIFSPNQAVVNQSYQLDLVTE